MRLTDDEGRLHCDDGPAKIGTDGSVEWWQHGHLHRTDGPALTYPGNVQRWYVDGVLIFNNNAFQQVAQISDEEMVTMILRYGNVRHDWRLDE